MRLLLDEHISRRVAEQLRARGEDVLAVTEQAELRGLDDEALLAWCTAKDRVIVTYDRDFADLLQQRLATETPTAGVVIVPSQRFPGGDRHPGRLLRALSALLEQPEDAVRGRLTWLTSEST